MARSRVSLGNAHTLKDFYPAVQRKTQHHALTPIVFNISLQCICNRKQDINFINTCTSSLFEVVRWLVSDWREAHLLIADSTLGRTAIFFLWNRTTIYLAHGKDDHRRSHHTPTASSETFLFRSVETCPSLCIMLPFALMCYTHWPLTVTGRSKTMSQHRCGITSTWCFWF